MTNFEWILQNYNEFVKCDKSNEYGICSLAYKIKNGKVCTNSISCNRCEFNENINVLKYLAEKHNEKIKVTQFEYDVIDSLKKIYNGSCNFVDINKFPILTKMKEKGYFKNIDINMCFYELCEKLEVEDV